MNKMYTTTIINQSIYLPYDLKNVHGIRLFDFNPDCLVYRRRKRTSICSSIIADDIRQAIGMHRTGTVHRYPSAILGCNIQLRLCLEKELYIKI